MLTILSESRRTLREMPETKDFPLAGLPCLIENSFGEYIIRYVPTVHCARTSAGEWSHPLEQVVPIPTALESSTREEGPSGQRWIARGDCSAPFGVTRCLDRF